MPFKVTAPEKLPWLAALDTGGRSGVRVGEILPAGYERYLRLFHPFVASGLDPDGGDRAPARTTWQALAEQVGTNLHPTLQWHTLEAAVLADGGTSEIHEGELEPVTRRRLFAHLQNHTDCRTSYFLYGIAAIAPGGEAFVVEAAIDEAEEVVEWVDEHQTTAVPTPELMWPEDRSWIVCTDYDLLSTYLATDSALARDLVQDPGLEVIEVSRDTRIDERADAG